MTRVALGWQQRPAVLREGTEMLLRRPIVVAQIGDVLVECIVDSGAWMSVFPHGVWSSFEGSIEWLSDESDLTVVVGGGAWRYRVGRVAVTLWTARLHRMSTERQIVARFLHSEAVNVLGDVKARGTDIGRGGELTRPLLSIGAGVFKEGQLFLSRGECCLWYLEEPSLFDEVVLAE